MYKVVLTRRKSPRLSFNQCGSEDTKVITVRKFPASRSKLLHQNTLRGHGVVEWTAGYYDVRLCCYANESSEPSCTVVLRVDALYI